MQQAINRYIFPCDLYVQMQILPYLFYGIYIGNWTIIFLIIKLLNQKQPSHVSRESEFRAHRMITLDPLVPILLN